MCFPRRRRLQVAEDIERGSARPTHGSPQSVSVHAARSERSPSWSLFKLTPYRLMSLALVLSLGIWKAVASYRNQALLSSTLDTLLTLCLPAIMFLIGLAADTCPPWLRWFYHQDLIVSLLQLLNYGAHPDIDAPADPLQMGHDPQDTDTASTRDEIAMPTATPRPVPQSFDPAEAQEADYEIRVNSGGHYLLQRGPLQRGRIPFLLPSVVAEPPPRIAHS